MAKSKVATRQTRSSKKKVEVEPEEEPEMEVVESSDEVDADDDEESDQEEEQESVEEGSGDDNENSEDDEDDDDDDDEEEEEELEEDNVDALFKGPVEDDEDEDEDSSDGRNLETTATPITFKGGPEQCNFDLRNMTAMNSHQILPSSLYTKAPSQEERSICIPLEDGGLHVNEDFLLERASAGCTQLIAAIWQLPSEMSDVGLLATLPGYDEIPIPRAMVRTRV